MVRDGGEGAARRYGFLTGAAAKNWVRPARNAI